MKLQRLRELALGATQGEWVNNYNLVLIGSDGDSALLNTKSERFQERHNAAYIAAACPANILPILESYEELLASFKKHGKHDSLCAIVGGYGYCNCGLEQAITNAEKLNHE